MNAPDRARALPGPGLPSAWLRRRRQRPVLREASDPAPVPSAAAQPLVRAAELQRALDDGELRLHFQPVVRMGDGRIEGAEALIRWQHPEHGLLSPAYFIPDAEASGMIVPIGEWVLAQGLEQAGCWSRRRPGFRMSLNVAVTQIRGRHEAFARSVQEHVARSGMQAADVCLEITETLALSATGGDRRGVDALRELGVAVALDDFATGHADPRLLEAYDLDVLKIDRSHVQAVRGQPAAREVITRMLLLARKLDMTTVAEGIETRTDHFALRALGCTHAQGYRYSPAVDVPTFTQLLDRGALPVAS